MDTATTRPLVFISYSRKDGKWLDALTTMLAPVVRTGIASVWWDKKIKPSQSWRREIDAALASARVAILLVSPNFLASDFIQDEELPFLLDAARRRGVTLLWTLVSPCLYQYSPLQDIQAAHDPSRPLSKLQGADRQEALASIGRAVVEALAQKAPLQESIVHDRKLEHLAGSGILHNLPFPPLGHYLTGREEELAALSDHGTTAITQSATISGLGGIGKTRLAVEYAWRNGSRYTSIWFVRADSPENLRRNLAALAGPEWLRLPEWGYRLEDESVAAVKRWLREHPDWLMIVDNVDTPAAAEAVLQTLPSLSAGRVLITSRLTNWPLSMWRSSLDKLSLGDAVRFLLSRTDDGREKSTDDEQQATSLALVLDGLPLALEQAAAFILRRRIRFSDYLQAWEQERSELLKWHDKRMMEYDLPVAVTWQQTFHRLSPKAAALLRLMAFLAPGPIPIDMFEQGSQFVEEAAQRLCAEDEKQPDELSIPSAFDELAEYSMISRQGGGVVTIHRIVQEVVQTLLQENRAAWINVMLQIVGVAPVGDPREVLTLLRWSRLRPHVEQITILADHAGIADPTIRLMSDLGQHLKLKALHPEAERWMRHALRIAEATLGTNNDRIAVQLSNLALLLQERDRSEEAERLMRRALEIEKAIPGRDPAVATGLINLALILRTRNRAEEAEALMRQALDIDQTYFGLEHPKVASDLINLAQLLQSMGRVQEAEPLMQRALSIDKAFFNEDNPRVARDLINLAQLLQVMNRLEEAELLMRRALEIDETKLGREHPDVSIDLSNLAMLLHSTDRPLEAEPLMRRALSIDKTFFGDEHPLVADNLHNLSRLLLDMGRLEEAEPLLRQVLEIHENTLDSNRPEVAIDLNNLAQLLLSMNRHQEAEPIMRRALEIDESFYGAWDPEVAIDLRNLAILLQSLDKSEEAVKLMRRALDIDEVAFGKEHPS